MAAVQETDERRTVEPPEVPHRRWPAWAVGTLLLAGTLLFWLPLSSVNLDKVNGYGLISVLPPATLAGAASIVLAFFLSLGFARPVRWLLTVEIVVTLVSLHYCAQSIEPFARFPTAWQHAGLVEYISRNHTTDAFLDARFSTPGFFAFVAFVVKAVGQHDIGPVLRVTPPVTELLYLIPYMLILRVLRATWRAKWLAAWLFVVADWVGQDYFSPQGFAFLLYLYFVAILVNWFRHHDETTRRAGRRRTAETATERSGPLWRVYTWIFGAKDPGELPAVPTGLREKRILFGLLMVLVVVGTAAHQLTPFLMTASAFGLVVARRCSLRGLPFIVGVVYAAWVSYMTVAYWAGHQSELFGGLGKFSQNLNSSVGGRIAKTDPAVANVQELRILLAVALMGLAGLGLLRRRWRGIDDRVALVLLLVPFTSFGLQNYGGELALRVYFFMLPAACLLAAYLFFPAPFEAPAVRSPAVRLRLGWLRAGPRRHWPPLAAASVFALLLTFGFVTVRYGNEEFEQVHPGDVKAFDTMLRETPRSRAIDVVWMSTQDPNLTGGTPVMPWGYRDFERQAFSFVLPSRDGPTDVAPIVQALRAAGPNGYFVTTRGNEDYQVLQGGLAPGYSSVMRRSLSASPLIRVVYSDPYAGVYALRRPPPEPVLPTPKPGGLGLRSSPWTPAGLIYLPVLLGVLMGRELYRLRLEPSQYRKLRPLTVLTIPLFLGEAAVIIERFVSIR